MAADWSVGTLHVGGRDYRIHRLAAVEEAELGSVERLPRSIRVLLENLLRYEDGRSVTRDDIAALAGWRADGSNARELAFRPARVLLQDFTGVPAVVDLAAMRDAVGDLGGDIDSVNPIRPVDLVIDHSVQIDFFGSPDAERRNAELEFSRNAERYAFLRWGQSAFEGFGVVPPDTGIVHQINLEYLASVVFREQVDGAWSAFPDTLVGADSHTTMVNALGVVGWGVGGIEAEAALCGQPISMLIPDVVGFKLHGRLPEGATATDLVLTLTERLREHGVVGKFVEFFGPGLEVLALADRATVSNMAPEYGATIGFFPVDETTLRYLRLTGRDEAQVELVEAYCREQGLFRVDGEPDPEYTDVLEIDLASIEPSLAGPRRPHDRIPLGDMKRGFERELPKLAREVRPDARVAVRHGDASFELGHGSVVMAAITSCTNTSNPSVMVAAGLLAQNAVQRGLRAQPWVKTSLAPGSRVVVDYLGDAGLLAPLEALGFYLVGYGCTTCIGNGGPLPEPIGDAVRQGDLVVAAVLSGNRNFEGRIHQLVRANYLASPPLVVAFALVGRADVDLTREPLGSGADGESVYLRDIWPSPEDVAAAVAASVKPEMFRERYGHVFEGSEAWRSIEAPEGVRYRWSDDSTYVKKPPYFDGMTLQPPPLEDVRGARVLALLGDSVTTDHISPAGSIPADGPAGRYLIEQGVAPADFNSFGARRGNHEVMIRGTFANVRLRNLLAPGTEGGYTTVIPDGDVMSIWEAAERYAAAGVPLVVLSGKAYGTGSSRDWAAKGTRLLGVRAVIAESYERIHRSNLIGMGVLPLQFPTGASAKSLGLTGHEQFDIEGIASGLAPRGEVAVRARPDPSSGGNAVEFRALVRIDTPVELDYFRHGGILPFVVRELLRD
jgi:aconitate hydratase